MLPDKHLRKSAEWTALNLKVATIYLHMGTALTWARRADLAFEYFQKALTYAEASGDAELISLVRKRVEEWRDVAKKISEESLSKSADEKFLQAFLACIEFTFGFSATMIILAVLSRLWNLFTR